MYPQNTKGLSLPYGSNSKWSYCFSSVLYIRCVLAFSIFINTSTRLVMFGHHFYLNKIHPEIEHICFLKSSLTAGLNASYGIPRGYFRWTNVAITPFVAIVSCNDRHWLVLSDLVHFNELWWPIMAKGGGRKAYRNSWTLDASFEPWTLVSVRWTLDSGVWTLRTLEARLWALGAELWILNAGLGRWKLNWTLNARPWTLKL